MKRTKNPDGTPIKPAPKKGKPKKTPKKKQKLMGRPSGFTDKVQEVIRTLSRRGFNDLELCDVLGITEVTLFNWKNKYPDFFKSLKDWKRLADGKVKRSLYERACGYSHPEEKIFLGPGGVPIKVMTTKHYPPETTAIIFWLANRHPELWKRNPDKIAGDSSAQPVKVTINVQDKSTHVDGSPTANPDNSDS